MPMFDFEIPKLNDKKPKIDLNAEKKKIEDKIKPLLKKYPFWSDMDNIVIQINDSLEKVTIMTKRGSILGYVTKQFLKIHNITNHDQNKYFSPFLHEIQDKIL